MDSFIALVAHAPFTGCLCLMFQIFLYSTVFMAVTHRNLVQIVFCSLLLYIEPLALERATKLDLFSIRANVKRDE